VSGVDVVDASVTGFRAIVPPGHIVAVVGEYNRALRKAFQIALTIACLSALAATNSCRPFKRELECLTSSMPRMLAALHGTLGLSPSAKQAGPRGQKLGFLQRRLVIESFMSFMLDGALFGC
jgi:hypothetical protein